MLKSLIVNYHSIPKLMSSIKSNMISNNVKGLQSYKKWLKFSEYLKNKSGPNGILFLQETFHDGKWN